MEGVEVQRRGNNLYVSLRSERFKQRQQTERRRRKVGGRRRFIVGSNLIRPRSDLRLLEPNVMRNERPPGEGGQAAREVSAMVRLTKRKWFVHRVKVTC